MARCLVVLVAFLALQATCNASLISDAFDSVKNRSLALIGELQDAQDNLQSKLVTQIDEVVTKAHDGIQTFAANVKAQVDGVVQKFEAAGKTALACSEKIPAETEDLVQNIVKDAASCITNEVDAGKSAILDLKAQAESINQTLTTAQAELSECQKNIFTAPTCTITAIAKASTALTSSAVSAASDIGTATATVAGFETKVSTCERNIITGVPTRVSNLMSTISACYTS